MDIADGIRRIGFRRWYERQLIESHLYFVTGFLSLIAALACAESVTLEEGFSAVATRGVIALLAMVVSFWSMQRYIRMLGLAQHAAERSVCGSCSTYGRLEVLRDGVSRPEVGANPWLKVRCRNCGHDWVIE